MAFLKRTTSSTLLLVLFLTTSLGCYEEVAPACETYVTCWDDFVAQTGAGDPNVIARFRFDGTCWNSPTTADDCTAICQYDIACLVKEYEAYPDIVVPAACVAAQILDVGGAPVTAHCQ